MAAGPHRQASKLNLTRRGGRWDSSAAARAVSSIRQSIERTSMTDSAAADTRFVDIHCHLLPGIDDGSSSWDESLRMAQMMVGDGIAAVVVTPHQLGSNTHNRGDDIRHRTDQLRGLLQQHQVPLQVLPGADVRIDTDMIPRLASGDCLTLGDRRRHVLLELPHELYLPLEPVLDQLAQLNLVGILSHPERNQGILNRPELIDGLVRRGCLMQVTADSLMGEFGGAPQRLAQWAVEQGYCHFLATDAHGARKRPPRMRRAFDRAVQLVGRPAAVAMCFDNPLSVAEGRSVAELPPIRRGSVMSRIGAALLGRSAA